MPQNILVILGHPDTQSFNGTLARSFSEGAQQSGAEVRMLNLGEISFDPILRHGYNHPQDLEPDLGDAQELVKWADHIAFIYPNWWGTMPALLKGFFDRTFLPGFAFEYRKGSVFWDKLLAGRTAELIVTMDTPPWYYRWIHHRPGHHEMRKTILGFCGIKVTRITEFAVIRAAPEQKRRLWIERVRKLGKNI